MRLSEPILSGWKESTIVLALLLAASPVMLFLAAGLGLDWVKRRAIGPRVEWRRWFAWHPVRVGFGDVRWLEIVERRSIGVFSDTHYRIAQGGEGHERGA